MRVWLAYETVDGDHRIGYQLAPSSGIVVVATLDPIRSPEVATFIVSACNAAEEEAAIIADKGVVAAATQRFRALELTQGEAGRACSLIRQRVRR